MDWRMVGGGRYVDLDEVTRFEATSEASSGDMPDVTVILYFNDNGEPVYVYDNRDPLRRATGLFNYLYEKWKPTLPEARQPAPPGIL